MFIPYDHTPSMSPARYSIFDVFSCTRSKKSCSWGSGFQIMLFNKKSMSQFFSKWDLLHLVILRIFVITLRFESWYLDASHNFQAVLWITNCNTSFKCETPWRTYTWARYNRNSYLLISYHSIYMVRTTKSLLTP